MIQRQTPSFSANAVSSVSFECREAESCGMELAVLDGCVAPRQLTTAFLLALTTMFPSL